MRAVKHTVSYEWGARVHLWLLALCACFVFTASAIAQHSNTHGHGEPAMEHAGHSDVPEKSDAEHLPKAAEMKTGGMADHTKHDSEAASDSGHSGHAVHPVAPESEAVADNVQPPIETKTPPMVDHAKPGAEAAPKSDRSRHAEHVGVKGDRAVVDHRAPQAPETPPAADHAGHGSEPASEADHSEHSVEAGGGLRQITLSPYAQKLAEIEVAPVQRKDVQVEIRMVGKIDYDETRLGYITAWVPGRLDRLYVDFTGTTVKEGDPLVYLYSPELLTAQAELLQAIRTVKEVRKTRVESILKIATQTVEAAQEKLRLWGFTKAQIEAVIQQGTPSDHMTVLAPMGGVVIHKNAFEGMYVQTGSRIYTIADLSSVWIKLDAYESDVEWIRLGQSVDFEPKSYPGRWFQGKVAFVDPMLDEKTRTVKVRLDVPNPHGSLKPGMFVHAVLRAPLSAHGHAVETPQENRPLPMVIPASAPLITGKRAVVYVQVPGIPGNYEGREIVLGPRAGNYYMVRAGLHEGELVVVNGAFKIDSALQIEAKPSMMTPEGGGGGGGHDHGGESPKKALPAAMGKMSVPAPFARQIDQLMTGYEQIAESIEQETLGGDRSVFHRFATLLDQVDGSLLTGHASMVWDELAMLLGNDAIEGMDARTREEVREAFSALKDHVERIHREFDLSTVSDDEGGHREHGS